MEKSQTDASSLVRFPICHVKQASGLGNLTTASHALYFKYRKIRSASKSSVVLAPQYSRPLYHACSLLFTPLFADTVTRPIHHRWQIFLQQPVVTVRHSGANGQREGGEVWMRQGWAGGGNIFIKYFLSTNTERF